MKKYLVLVLLSILKISVYAQSPHAIPYQAILRNVSGGILSNQSVKLRFTLLDSSTSGNILYQERHSIVTNASGLANVSIGSGDILIGTFGSIDWGKNSKFIQVELDAQNNDVYTDLGTTQFLSVPYALYAENAGNGGFQHYVGEKFGGGVVFFVYKDTAGAEHGLVVSLVEQATDIPWGCYNQMLNAASLWDGKSNTDAIVSTCGFNTAAGVCRNYNAGNFNDWFLPSLHEIELLYNNKYLVNQSLASIPGAQVLDLSGNYYWTSSSPSSITVTNETSTTILYTIALAYNTPFNAAPLIEDVERNSTYIRTRAIRKF